MSEPDSQTMVEVIAEFREAQKQRLEAAQDMIVPYVIRAFLDGAEPKELAALCGFTDQPQTEPDPESYEAMFRHSIFYGTVKLDPVTMFASWISERLATLIKEAVDG